MPTPQPTAPRRLPSLRRTLATYGGANAFAAAVRMAGGLLTAKLLGPAALGLFQGISLVLGYLPFADLGVSHGLNREVPYWTGRNEPDEVRSLTATALSWSLLIGVLSAVALFGVGVWHGLCGRWPQAAGFAAVGVQAFLFFVSTNYLETVYRTHHAFKRVSGMYVIRAIAGLGLVLAVWLMGFYGMCLRAAGMGLIGFVLLWRWNPVKASPHWRLDDFKKLVKVGFSVLIVVEVSRAWAYLNRTLIFLMMGERELGLYMLYPMMFPALNLLPNAVHQVVYPRLTTMYGRTGSVRQVTRYALRPILLLTVAMTPVVAAVWLLLPWGVGLLLPKYLEGVAAARWAVLDVFVLCLMQVRMVFFTIKKQHWVFLSILLGIASYVGALAWLLRDETYLEGFPQAMLVGRFTYVAACCLVLTVLWRREKHAGDGERAE